MQRPNFVLKDTCHPEPYTAPQDGMSKPPIKRDRGAHSAKLIRQLTDAFSENNKKSAHAVVDRAGTYLEFKGPQNGDLVTNSLDSIPQGVRLLNVRQQDNVTYATVFIPSGKERFFLDRIEAYGDPNRVSEKGTAPNEKLVSSIEDIRLAIIDSLWTGREENRPGATRRWLEIWLRTSKDEDGSSYVNYISLLDALGIKHKGTYILFPERMVTMAYANKSDLAALLDSYDGLAEIKEAPLASSFFANLDSTEQREWIDDLLRRTTFDPDVASVCILDTGINNGNPLLSPAVDDNVVLAYDDTIGTADRDNHGTKLAGLALYNDLKGSLASNDPVTITHTIESVKILDMKSQNDPDLYGDVAKRAIDKAFLAKPKSNRVFCSGVTAEPSEITDGLPTSWSAALDEAISHADDPASDHELVIISGGNITLGMMEGTVYPEANENRSVRSPGQSWNALTVGAYTENAQVEEEDILASGYEPVAMPGELCPFSTTSLQWRHTIAPVKPEIICPGGNVIEKDGDYSDCQDLSLLTTGANASSRPLDTINATSAAVAEAAYMAAELENAYPDLWPETIRGLLVHSARWSSAMINRYSPKGSAKDSATKGRRRLLRSCGYGIPDLSRAIECKENSVNLIIQGSLHPYMVKNGRETMREMHFHTLPWPKNVLASLAEADATLHVTLSYYIEPGPGQIGWKDKYRYASHGLRFDVNKPGESWTDFEKRINVSVRDEDEGKRSSGSGEWYLGVNNRNVGSIHSDYKYTSAIELSDIEYVAIYPVIGWWRSRKYLGKIDSEARYSLIVTIETPGVEVDLYSEIAQAIENTSATAIPIAASRLR